MVHGWPDAETYAKTVLRSENGEEVEEIDAFVLITHEQSTNSAYYEGAVAFYLGNDVYAAARFGLLSPSSDEAGGSYGKYYVHDNVPPSQWNNDSLHRAIDGVFLEGSLPKYGTSGDDEVEGSESDDVILLGDGNDVADGDEGDDRLNGQGGNDIVAGGPGRDRVLGGSGNDKLYGDTAPGEAAVGRTALRAAEADTASNDVLSGGPGSDVADGGEGADKLIGGAGLDVLKGGPGTDTCVFDSAKEIRKSSSCEHKKRNF
jgi:Ca2+-binding RTX toxin-like protein